jgi:hypothetical protein
VILGPKKLPELNVSFLELRAEYFENGAPKGSSLSALWDMFMTVRLGKAKMFEGSAVRIL